MSIPNLTDNPLLSSSTFRSHHRLDASILQPRRTNWASILQNTTADEVESLDKTEEDSGGGAGFDYMKYWENQGRSVPITQKGLNAAMKEEISKLPYYGNLKEAERRGDKTAVVEIKLFQDNWKKRKSKVLSRDTAGISDVV